MRYGRLLGLIGVGGAGAYAYGLPADAPVGMITRSTIADRDCADFATQAEAQAFFLSHGPGDLHRLDADNDGRACEALR